MPIFALIGEDLKTHVRVGDKVVAIEGKVPIHGGRTGRVISPGTRETVMVAFGDFDHEGYVEVSICPLCLRPVA